MTEVDIRQALIRYAGDGEDYNARIHRYVAKHGRMFLPIPRPKGSASGKTESASTTLR
jgi:hypothetical protein